MQIRKMIIVCIAFLAFQSLTNGISNKEEIKFGVAVQNITPPVGCRRDGNFREIITTGIHDSLYVKALVFEQANEKGALVFCDLTSISLDVSKEARKIASAKTDIPFSNILIAATHAHTAPLYHGIRMNIFNKKSKERNNGRDPHHLVGYKEKLIKKIVDAICEAKRLAKPLNIETGLTWQTGLSFYRRFYMKPGSKSLRQPGSTVRMNPGRKNPDIIRPAGRIDPEVGILLLRDPESNIAITSLVNFPLHLDTKGGTEFSADYPYYLEQFLKEKIGEQFVSLFALGACGNLNHIDVIDEKRLSTDEIGNSLAKTVYKEIKWLDPIIKPKLTVTSSTIQIPFKTFKKDQIERAHRYIEKMGSKEIPWLDQVQAYSILSIEARQTKKLPVEIQVFAFGKELALVGLPGEVFVELGQSIKKASPFKTTFIIELSNDALGYIPTKEGFEQGDYEIVNSRIKQGGGEKIVEAAVVLLKELMSKYKS
jgi:hypothetical protein